MLSSSQLSVNELYSKQSHVWDQKNRELFGLSANQTDNPFTINQNLEEDLEDYWLNGTCAVKEKLLNGALKYQENMIKDSWGIEYNSVSNLVAINAKFIFETKNTSKRSKDAIEEIVREINELPKEERERLTANGEIVLNGETYVISKIRIAFLPLVLSLGYKLKNSVYSLRTKITRNKYLLRKINGVVKQKGWEYSDGKFADGVNHFKDVHECNYPLLNAILKEQVTEENFTRALDLMPEYSPTTVTYFDFAWFEEVEHKVLSARRVSNPKSSSPINYASLINSRSMYSKEQEKDLQSNLVSSHSKLKALEITRSVIYAPPTTYLSAFNFTDASGLFDAFKVPTNNTAGRNRIMLDDVFVEDHMLKVRWKDKVFNQFDIIFGNVPQEFLESRSTNLSSLSRSQYNYLNDAKRIMFCAKLRGQAVRVKGQIDDLSHGVMAKVVFADWEGYNFGDSFVISESFAKKLEREVTAKFEMRRTEAREYEIGQRLSINDLVQIDQKNRFSSWRDIHVTNVLEEAIEVTARAPFGVGDKITNMHGAKGIVSVILPDSAMPQLKNDLSDNMKAGPVDVIIPGISVFRRKSAGQIFEAVTRALDIPELSLQELNDKYGDEIREYDKKSEFTFLGKEFSAPCGINQFIRLDHDATSKQSFAYIKSNYNYNLHVAEMELLNLAARGYYNILNELDIRSLNKHTNALNKIVAMQKNGSISEEPMNSSYLNIYMRYLGWDMRISNKLSNEEVDARWNALVSLFPTEENEQDVDDNALAEFYAAIEEEKKRESEDDTDMIDFEWGSPIDLSDEILDNDEVDIFDMTEEQQDMGDLPAAAREYLENIEE